MHIDSQSRRKYSGNTQEYMLLVQCRLNFLFLNRNAKARSAKEHGENEEIGKKGAVCGEEEEGCRSDLR